MSVSKQGSYTPDAFKNRDTVYVIPSATWHGGKEYIGKKQKAVIIDGDFYDADYSMFVMGEGHWELVT